MQASSRRRLFTFLKTLIGLLMIWYVLRYRMIDFAALRDVVFLPRNLVMAAAFLSFTVFCNAWRWHLLSKAQGLKLPLFSAIELTMIGGFFTTFMPGAAGGDVVKAWYFAGLEPQRKTRAVFTVLLNRVLALVTYVFISAASLFIYRQWFEAHPQLELMGYALTALAIACLVGGLFFYLPIFRRWWPTPATVQARGGMRGFVNRLLETILIYRDRPSAVLAGLAITAVSLFATCVYWKLMGDELGIGLDFGRYCFVVPVGVIAVTIPLLPGGIGVGQVAFFTLFQWAGIVNPALGATLCTLAQIYTTLFNCLGAVFYVRFRRQPSTAIS